MYCRLAEPSKQWLCSSLHIRVDVNELLPLKKLHKMCKSKHVHHNCLI